MGTASSSHSQDGVPQCTLGTLLGGNEETSTRQDRALWPDWAKTETASALGEEEDRGAYISGTEQLEYSTLLYSTYVPYHSAREE